MQELVQRIVRRGFKQSSGIEAKHIDGDQFPVEFREKQPAVLGQQLSRFKILEGAGRSFSVFSMSAIPCYIDFVGPEKILSSSGHAHSNPMLFRITDIPATVFGKLLEKCICPQRQIEHDTPQ